VGLSFPQLPDGRILAALADQNREALDGYRVGRRPTTHNGVDAWQVQTRINEDAGAPAHGSIYAVCVG